MKGSIAESIWYRGWLLRTDEGLLFTNHTNILLLHSVGSSNEDGRGFFKNTLKH